MMGIYSLVLLFLGILIIGLVYAKTDNDRISHHVLFAIILLLFLVTFFTIHHEVYRQQQWMYDHHEHRIDDRIVSVSQPHVRPIKRGKAGAATEFGAKISVSLVEGFSFVDRISWDAYNESGDLIGQIESYRKRFGHYPESVHADQIYRTRGNRKYCKKHGIRLSGPPLGRPPAEPEKRREIKLQAYQDELDRIPIEGKFGQAKRRFSLARVMCKLAMTSETAIMVAFLVMNLEKWLKSQLFYLFSVFQTGLFRLIDLITPRLMVPIGISGCYCNLRKNTWKADIVEF